jgi:hypothetical protein
MAPVLGVMQEIPGESDAATCRAEEKPISQRPMDTGGPCRDEA